MWKKNKEEITITYADFVELGTTERGEVPAGRDALVERVLRRLAVRRLLDVRGQLFQVGLPDPRRQQGVLLAQRRLGPEQFEVGPAVAAGLAKRAAVVEHPEAPAAAREGALAPAAAVPPSPVHAHHRHAAAEGDLPVECPLHRRRPPLAANVQRPAHRHGPRVIALGRADVRRRALARRGRRLGCHFLQQLRDQL